ncbi:MAG TPA: hypothetical protein VFN35_32280 [Ktedonobacteraceae bacterium]|nr:hypothetical protein [Ktedonobacteraceae bacterium]
MQTPTGPDTQSTNMRIALVINLFPFGLLIWMIVTQISQPSRGQPLLFVNPWFSGVIGLCYLYLYIRMYRQWRFLQHLAKRRQYLFSPAASRPDALESHFGELVSPITLRYRGRAIWFGIIVILVVLLPPTLDLVMGSLREIASEGFFLSMIPSLFIIAFEGGLLVFLFVAWYKTSQTVWVTDHGLTLEKKSVYYQRENITWQEVQLFTCYKKPPILGRRGTAMTCELSNPEKIFTWLYLCETKSFSVPWKPLLPSDTYHAQMQEICRLVEEETGLMLHNLDQSYLGLRINVYSLIRYQEPPEKVDKPFPCGLREP